MNGALPPSSKLNFLMPAALSAKIFAPVSVEPVKLILRTMGLCAKVCAMSAAEPHTIWNRSSGTPASYASTAWAYALNGVKDAGLTNMAQPTAKAGAALRVIMAAGKFHGVMAAATPIGCLMTSSFWLAFTLVSMSPSIRRASSANQRTKAAA